MKLLFQNELAFKIGELLAKVWGILIAQTQPIQNQGNYFSKKRMKQCSFDKKEWPILIRWLASWLDYSITLTSYRVKIRAGRSKGVVPSFQNISTIVFFGHSLEENHNCFRAKKVDNGFLVCVSMPHDDLCNIWSHPSKIVPISPQLMPVFPNSIMNYLTSIVFQFNMSFM